MLINSIFILAIIIAGTFFMRYYLHMFQLNSYKMKEFILWIYKHKVQLLGKVLFILLAIICFSLKWSKVVSIVLILCTVFLNLPKNEKIPLHYTMRIKRLIITFYIIFISAISVLGVWLKNDFNDIILCGLLIFIPLVLLIANICNQPMEKMITLYYINDAKKILKSASELIVVGITGSYGKTSMKYILNELLSLKYNTLITPGNYNTTLGVVRTVREYLRPIHQVFLCEMGAKNQGDIKEICDLVHPNYGVITSIGPQHLESFKSIDTIIQTKFELVDGLKDGGMAFLNYDNEFIRTRMTHQPFVSYGVEQVGSNIVANRISLTEKGAIFFVTDEEGNEVEFQTALIGRHNVLNIIGAISVALQLGIPLQAMQQKIKRLKPIPHRLELKKHQNITIIDDAYNSNPLGAKLALETLGMFQGLKILVTPGMVELGQKEVELNMKFGEQATEVADVIVLVGKKQSKPIYQGIENKSYDMDKVFVANDFNSAMEYVYSLESNQRKVVLLENDLPDNYK